MIVSGLRISARRRVWLWRLLIRLHLIWWVQYEDSYYIGTRERWKAHMRRWNERNREVAFPPSDR
jgi:hypothetical protein